MMTDEIKIRFINGAILTFEGNFNELIEDFKTTDIDGWLIFKDAMIQKRQILIMEKLKKIKDEL